MYKTLEERKKKATTFLSTFYYNAGVQAYKLPSAEKRRKLFFVLIFSYNANVFKQNKDYTKRT